MSPCVLPAWISIAMRPYSVNALVISPKKRVMSGCAAPAPTERSMPKAFIASSRRVAKRKSVVSPTGLTCSSFFSFSSGTSTACFCLRDRSHDRFSGLLTWEVLLGGDLGGGVDSFSAMEGLGSIGGLDMVGH
jgi:hypothetical protein